MEIKLKLAKSMYKEAAYAAAFAGVVTREFIRMAIANELARREAELCRVTGKSNERRSCNSRRTTTAR